MAAPAGTEAEVAREVRAGRLAATESGESASSRAVPEQLDLQASDARGSRDGSPDRSPPAAMAESPLAQKMRLLAAEMDAQAQTEAELMDAGWTEEYDEASESTYWLNSETGETSWEAPVPGEPQDPAAAESTTNTVDAVEDDAADAAGEALAPGEPQDPAAAASTSDHDNTVGAVEDDAADAAGEALVPGEPQDPAAVASASDHDNSVDAVEDDAADANGWYYIDRSGVQQGPHPLEHMRYWVQNGGIPASTQAKPSLGDEFSKASAFPEITDGIVVPVIGPADEALDRTSSITKDRAKRVRRAPSRIEKRRTLSRGRMAAAAAAAEDAPRLTREELAFFVEHGYLVKTGLMPLEHCDATLDAVWASNKSCKLQRDDPSTWPGPFWTRDETDTGLGTRVVGNAHFVDSRRGYRWHARLCSADEAVMDALPRAVMPIAEQLLGEGEVEPPAPSGTQPHDGEEMWTPRWTRGVYGTLPGAKRKTDHSGIHTDGHEFHLGCVGYVDDCAPEGGGFRVWPGSHRTLWPTFERAYSQRHEDAEWSAQWTDTVGSPAYTAAIAELKKVEPVDCHGPKGTVVFWHHRLGHDAGHNVSKNIRMAILHDFTKKVIDDTKPPQAEIFRDWSSEVREIAAASGWDAAPAGGVSVELKAATTEAVSRYAKTQGTPPPTQPRPAKTKASGGGGGGGGCCGSRPAKP